MQVLVSNSEEQTKKIAANLASSVKIPALICLFGNLGSGKTVFTKGFASSLGIKEKEVKSPTYTFLRSYKLGKNELHHFDFYRIEEPDDILSSSLEEIFEQKNALTIIEWPERILELLPKQRIDIYFQYLNENTRAINIKSKN